MDGLGIMAEHFHGVALIHTEGFGPLRPGVAVGVEGDSGDSEGEAALPEVVRTAFFLHSLEIWEKITSAREAFQNHGGGTAEAHERGSAGLFPAEGDDSVLPINVLGAEVGEVGLGGAQMPGEFVKGLLFRIWLAVDYFQVFIPGDGAFFFEADCGPLLFGKDWPRHPAHPETEIVEFSEVHVGADGSGLEGGEKMFGLRLNQNTTQKAFERLLVRSPNPAFLCWAGFCLDQRIEGLCPSPGAGSFIAG